MASLQEARRDRDEAVARMVEEDKAALNQETRGSGGVVENIEKGARSFLDAVTGTTKGKAWEASDKARDTKDVAMEKAGEVKDRAKGGVEETKERAGEAKDRGNAKLMDYEGASPRKASPGDKAGEYKESAAEAARKAREFLGEGKEEARIKLAGKTKDQKGQTNESARKQSDDVKQRAAEKAEEDRGRLDEPSESDKGRSAADNIYGAFPSMNDSLKEKMTLPKDVVASKRGEPDSSNDARKEEMREKAEDDIMLRVKEADQMTGTGFTDPGKMGGEGTGPAAQDQIMRDKEDDIMLRVKQADQMTGIGFTDPGKMGGEGTGIAGRDGRNKQ